MPLHLLLRAGLEAASEFTPYPTPTAKPILPSKSNPKLSLSRNNNSPLKKFGTLLQEAVKKGAVGVVVMLQRHSLLKPRYIQDVFYHLVEELPQLLPQSGDFFRMTDVDPEQLDLFITFCNQLKDVHTVRELRQLQFRQNTYLSQLVGVQLFSVKTCKRQTRARRDHQSIGASGGRRRVDQHQKLFLLLPVRICHATAGGSKRICQEHPRYTQPTGNF